MNNNNKYFCSLPWVHLDLESGDTASGVTPCCWFQRPHLYEMDPNHPLYDYVKEHGLNKSMNSPAFKQIRKNMLEGKPTKGCFRCYDEEQYNGDSMRMFANQMFDISNKKLDENFLHTKYIEVTLDNTCNLECKMCNSEYSTKLRRRDELIGFYVHPNVTFDPNLLDNVDLNHVERIKFLGGEPLLSKNHLPFLKKIPNRKNVTLVYNTNATRIPSHETLEIMKEAKTLDFIISCDGIYKYNDYQRWGSKFETIIENGLKLRDTFNNIGYFTFLSTFTMLTLNSHNQTMEWFKKNNYQWFSNWDQGGVLSAWHAPDWYEEWILKYNDSPGVRNYFKRRKHNPGMWKKFLNLIEVSDKLYNTRLEDYNPELAEQLHKHGDYSLKSL